MSRFRVIPTSMWHDAKFRDLGPGQPDPQKLWIYLITGPETSMVPGLYRATRGGLADGIRWSLEGFDECFEQLRDRGMVVPDWHSQLVWLPNAIKHQWPSNQSVVVGWVKAIREMPECALLEIAVGWLVEQLEAYDAAEQEAAAGSGKKRRRKKKERLATPLRALLDEMRAKKAARAEAPRWAPHLTPCLTRCPSPPETPCDTWSLSPTATLTADVSRLAAETSRADVPRKGAERGPESASAEGSEIRTIEEGADGSGAPETLENQAFAEECEAETQVGGHPVGQGAEQGLGQGTGYGVPDQDQDQDQSQDQDQEQEIYTHTEAREARAGGSVDVAPRDESEGDETTETAPRDEASEQSPASAVNSEPAVSSEPQESEAAVAVEGTAAEQLDIEDVERVCSQEHGWALSGSKQALSRIEALCPVSGEELQRAVATTEAQAEQPGYGYVASVPEGMRRGGKGVAEAIEHEKALLVFGHYRKYHPRSHRHPSKKSKEYKKILDRLREGYTVEELCLAIDGCHKSPHHLGQNDKGTEYTSLELIVRDASHVDMFLKHAEKHAKGVQPVLSTKTMQTIRASESWMAMRQQQREEEAARCEQ